MKDGRTQRRRFLLIACSAIVPLRGWAAGAATVTPTPASAANPTEAGVHTVTIDAFAFKPPVVSVDRGATIVWRNDDPVPHSVTAAGSFDSGAIASGGSWRYTAATPGRYEYICSFHPMMKGLLVVR